MTEEARLDITLRFWLPPSAEHFEGRLQRFTSRLVIFRTRTRVPVGAAIRFSVCTAQSGNVSCTHPLPARAERVERAGEDYEVAAAFHAADNIMKQDKRRQIRHSVDLTGRFWRTTARVPFTCRIRDISPNGARFIVEGALLRFEKIRLEIDPPASASSARSSAPSSRSVAAVISEGGFTRRADAFSGSRPKRATRRPNRPRDRASRRNGATAGRTSRPRLPEAGGSTHPIRLPPRGRN